LNERVLSSQRAKAMATGAITLAPGEAESRLLPAAAAEDEEGGADEAVGHEADDRGAAVAFQAKLP
jgi:hypothetical protein